MKTLGSDINAENGIIRIHSPEKLQGQEAFKKERAQVLQDKLALEESVEPTMAQLFKLYYLEPVQAKTTLDNLFGLGEQAAAEGARRDARQAQGAQRPHAQDDQGPAAEGEGGCERCCERGGRRRPPRGGCADAQRPERLPAAARADALPRSAATARAASMPSW